MSEKAYSAKRWTEKPKFSTVGNFEISEEEKKQYDAILEDLMRKNGVLDSTESSKKE